MTSRAEIISILTFPRMLALDELAAAPCPHGGRYHEGDASCRVCSRASTCAWLTGTDAFRELASRPAQDLLGELRFAADYVDGHPSYAGHNSLRCSCRGCRWLYAARQLLREADGRAETVFTD